jgi:hypothetical protein
MIDVIGNTCHRTCDGFTRRDFLRVGALTVFGLTFGDFLKMKAYGDAKDTKAKSVILLWMSGGPSHIDTWDPKPDAPEDYRGPFKAIETNVKGIFINEHLPLMAQQADKFSIVRGFTHVSPAHEIAHHLVLTGNVPQGGLVYPSWGSVVALEKGFKSELPPFVAVPNPPPWYGEAGFMGGNYKPFTVGSDPNSKDFRVRGLTMPKDVSDERIKDRRGLLKDMDELSRQLDKEDSFKVVDSFYERAYSLITGEAKKAFDIAAEPDKVRDEYGRSTFGQSCLLARRLVERGVPFITVHKGGWDTHFKNFENVKSLNTDLDKGFSALLQDLQQRGLLESTIVVWAGEFGRTPKIDWSSQWQGGRHHYPNVFSVVVAGGGFKGGQVVGSSDAKAEAVKERPCLPWDLAASVYKLMGIDHTKRLPHPQGRVAYTTALPLGVVSGGLLNEIM